MGRDTTTQVVRSVERATRLLEALSLAPEGKHLAELSTEIGLHKTTVLRLLRTLVAVGLVQREPSTDHYRFEPLRWVTMTYYMRQTMEHARLVQDVLDRLTQGIGQTTVLVVPDFERRRTILSITSQPKSAVRVDLNSARVAPMHASAAGKTLLAHFSDEELERWLLAPLQAVTSYTITDRGRLVEEVRQARQQGYARACQEDLLGVSSMAVAVCDGRGRAVGAVGAAIVGDTVPEDRIAGWLPLLRGAADEIAELLYTGRVASVMGVAGPQPEDGQQASSGGKVVRGETPLRTPYRMV